MFRNPGFESFQAFRDLNIKSLLYYQAELVGIREELLKVEWKDHINGGFEDSDQLCERVDTLLLTETKDGKEKAERQIQLIKKMRRVLKEYSKIIFHTAFWGCQN